jgi:type IV secretory pathway VirB2 component (pilin)
MTRKSSSSMGRWAQLGILVLAIVGLPDLASAATGGGSGLPWETPLETLRDSITGPVAYTISLLGVVVAGAALVFGGEINDFVRRMIMLVLVISLIIFAANFLSTLFNTGAVIP